MITKIKNDDSEFFSFLSFLSVICCGLAYFLIPYFTSVIVERFPGAFSSQYGIELIRDFYTFRLILCLVFFSVSYLFFIAFMVAEAKEEMEKIN